MTATERAPGAEVADSEAEALDAYSRSVTAVAERLSPSVANLRVLRRMRGGRAPAGAGSGVVLTPDGFLLTSAHVVEGPGREGRAALVDGRELRFEVVGRDPLSDLAVLRAEARDLVACGARRGRVPARRPARGRDRQPERLRRVGDRRRRVRARSLAARARARRRPGDRQPGPDRRRAQPRQLGRRAGRQPRPRGGGEHRGRGRGARPGRADQRGDPAGDRRAHERGPRAPRLPGDRRRAAAAPAEGRRRPRRAGRHRGHRGRGRAAPPRAPACAPRT